MKPYGNRKIFSWFFFHSLFFLSSKDKHCRNYRSHIFQSVADFKYFHFTSFIRISKFFLTPERIRDKLCQFDVGFFISNSETLKTDLTVCMNLTVRK